MSMYTMGTGISSELCRGILDVTFSDHVLAQTDTSSRGVFIWRIRSILGENFF